MVDDGHDADGHTVSVFHRRVVVQRNVAEPIPKRHLERMGYTTCKYMAGEDDYLVEQNLYLVVLRRRRVIVNVELYAMQNCGGMLDVSDEYDRRIRHVVKRNGQHPFQHDGRVNHLFSRLPPYVRQPPLVIHLHFAYPAIRCRLLDLWVQAVKRNVRGFWGFRPFSFCASKSGRCTPDSFSLYHPDEIQVHHLCHKPPRSCEHGQQNHGTLKVILTIARYGTHLLESVGSIQGALRPCLCR